MWRFRMIFKSIKKQGLKFKIVFFQLIIIFIALNFAFTLINKNIDLKEGINKFIDKDRCVLLGFFVPSDIKDPVNLVDTMYENISKSPLVNNISVFI